MKRLLLLCWHPEPPYSGGSYNCQLNSFEYHTGDSSVELHIIDKTATQLERFSGSNVSIYTYRVPGIISKIRDLFFPLGRLIEWAYVIRKMYTIAYSISMDTSFDAIYLPVGENNQLLVVAERLSKDLGIPVFAMVHQFGASTVKSNVEIGRKQKLLSMLETGYINLSTRSLKQRLKRIKGVATISSELKIRLEHEIDRRVTLIPYGFDQTLYAEVKVSRKKFDGVYLGRLIESKGLEDLISIWKGVVVIRPKAQLLIIGDGKKHYVDTLRNLVTQLNLEKNIVFKGSAKGVEKVRLLKQSRVFTFFSHFESHSDVITEAIVCNLPIVCYDLPAYSTRAKYTDSMHTYSKTEHQKIVKMILKLIETKKVAKSKRLNELPDWRDFAMKEKDFLLEKTI